MNHAMSFVTMNLVTMMYLIASVCFIQALKGLSSPATARRGNAFGMIGMTIAVLTTGALIARLSQAPAVGLAWVLLGLLVGGTAGTIMAKRVEMTKMPELVAFMHSMIGLAAEFIAAPYLVRQLLGYWAEDAHGRDCGAVVRARAAAIVGSPEDMELQRLRLQRLVCPAR